MPSFDSLKDLERYVNQMAKKAMNQGNAVKNTVIEEGKKNIDDMVYSYKPKRYDRSYDLRDKSWDSEETADGIAISNTRKDEDSGKDIVQTIETGQGYDYTGYGYDYERPRPFMEKTAKSLDGSSKLSNALKQDMKSIGLDVE